jgi:hypothetical protein
MFNRSRKISLTLLLAVGCLLGLSAVSKTWHAQTQAYAQQSPGPKPGVDETVLAPKKSQPSPETLPGEKKPERIDPSKIYTGEFGRHGEGQQWQSYFRPGPE